jgi:hypothetical protein
MHDSMEGYGFCPGKLGRDDPGTDSLCRGMFVRWKAGRIDYDNITFEEVNRFYVFIRLWEGFEKQRDFRFLARLIGGDGKK